MAEVEIGRYPRRRDGMEHVLVVLSQGMACWLMPAEDGFALLVEESDVDAAKEQLRRYDLEREPAGAIRPERSVPVRRVPPAARLSALLWALAETLSYAAETHHPGWVQAGELDPAAIYRHGQLWRPLTALFLHADAGHLLSNLPAAYFAFCGVLGEFGLARGWLLLGAASVAANFADAAVHLGDAALSLGASTAVFAALGLLTGRAARVARRFHRTPASLLLPLGAGGALLALFGGGAPGVAVDLTAHVAGFAAGAGLGAACRLPGSPAYPFV